MKENDIIQLTDFYNQDYDGKGRLYAYLKSTREKVELEQLGTRFRILKVFRKLKHD